MAARVTNQYAVIQPPLSIYVHLPWCVRKCPYCDFNSHPLSGELPQSDYLSALQRDLEIEFTRHGDRPIQTLFFGGGTPNLFSAESIASLIDRIGGCFAFAEDIEITLEANPGADNQLQYADYRQAGINRLSIGVQSFNDQKLVMLGRIHDATQAKQTIYDARNAGFDNLNLDLMYGLPDQNKTEIQQDITQAIQFEPTHLSLYQLTIEANTPFHHMPPTLPSIEDIDVMQQLIEQTLATQGFNQYEVSAYAQPGSQCRHNLNYWRFGDYIGIGAGAHSKLTLAKRVKRYWKLAHPRHYMAVTEAHDMLGGQTVLKQQDLLFEYLFNALRLSAGFKITDMVSRTGIASQAIQQHLLPLVQKGWLEITDNHVQCSALGYRFLDTVLTTLLPDNPDRSCANY